MRTIVTTPPAIEPVTLTEAKLHLRLAVGAVDAAAYTTEDAEIEALITSARVQAENETGRAFITTTFTGFLDEWPSAYYITPDRQFQYIRRADPNELRLPFPNLQSVVSVKYDDANGIEQTFTEYQVDVPGNRIVITQGLTPALKPYAINRVRIEFKCGYGDTSASVPAPIKSAMLLLIGHLYQNREATGAPLVELPLSVNSLLYPYKDVRHP